MLLKKVLVLAAVFGLWTVGASAQDAPSSQGMLAKALADGKATLAPVAPPRGAPTTYGTSHVSYYKLSAPDFLPYTSAITYADAGGGVGAFNRYPTAGSDFLGTVHLPSGAMLTYFEADYCNTSVAGNFFAATLGCDYHGQNCVPLSGTLIGGPNPTCTNVQADLTPAAWTVDNFQNQVIIIMEPGATDGTISFGGAIIGYVLQVSPAPGVATFPDVPTSDFGFQYVEALAASGITGGCGGGNYCPDSFVTRRQMAIFIAKALGLQWN